MSCLGHAWWDRSYTSWVHVIATAHQVTFLCPPPPTLTHSIPHSNPIPMQSTDHSGPQGGGHCLFEGRYPKQNYRPPVLCYLSPLSLSLLVYSPLFLRHQRKAYCYYCCYRNLPPVDIIFSCPDTISLITVAKTLIIANPGCFPWTSHGASMD